MKITPHRSHRHACYRRSRPVPKTFLPDRERVIDLQLRPHLELEKLLRGLADHGTPGALAFRVAVGQAMARRYFDDVAQGVMDAAAHALDAIDCRHRQLGLLHARVDEIRVIGHGLNLADDMQAVTTRREQWRAHLFAARYASRRRPKASLPERARAAGDTTNKTGDGVAIAALIRPPFAPSRLWRAVASLR